jgi:hypothetical protein
MMSTTARVAAQKLGVGQLLERLQRAGIDTSFCVGKDDLLRLVGEHGVTLSGLDPTDRVRILSCNRH